MTQAALRVAGALWALDPSLAQQRQFPAVDWGTSYSLQVDGASRPGSRARAAPAGSSSAAPALELLQRGRELKDIAGLVGPDALQDADRMALESARILQELVLGQSAYDDNDASSPVTKTYQLASLALALHRRGLDGDRRRYAIRAARARPRAAGAGRRSRRDTRRGGRASREADRAIERIAGETVR